MSMKNFTHKFIGILALVFAMSFSVNAQDFGEIYEGGYIFQINEDGTGLVADISDLPVMTWYNTITAAESHNSGGYDDWFLPSKEELSEMYQVIGPGASNVGGFNAGFYFSSTEDSPTRVWYVNFENGGFGTKPKTNISTSGGRRLIRAVSFQTEVISGCTDITAFNFDVNSNTDDGSCFYGCEPGQQLYNQDGLSYCYDCPAGTYGDGIYCNECPTGSYTDQEGQSYCMNASYCSASQYELAAPTVTTDRACAALSVCSDSQYELAAPTVTSDRACAELSYCSDFQYELTEPTVTSDRVCGEQTHCSASQYELTAPTVTTDRACAELSVCSASQYELTAPSVTSDRVCAELSVCSASQYELTAPTVTSDRVCEYVVTGCTDSSNTNYNSEANTDDGSCVSWEELATELQDQLDAIIPEDGITQADVDAAYQSGVASVEVPECEEIATQNLPLDLPEGWSMFGYTCMDSTDVVTGFASIADKIEIVKDEMGLTYLPSWDFNAMGGLHFSEGYQIKMLEEVSDFQFCEAIVPEDGVSQADVDAAHAMYAGWCASDIDNDGICDVDEVSGCMDASSCNYVSTAEFDDGSCDYASCLDECGVINGDNSSCIDCAGLVNGTTEDLGCGCGNPAAQIGYDCDGNEIVVLQIGDQHAGGIVFQINEDGTGLVADLEDLEPMDWYSAMGAAEYATSQGYDDWHLPSIEELGLMYSTIGQGGPEGNIGGFEYVWYWSSSELNNDVAWVVYFDYGDTDYFNKSNTYRVRVIRAF